MNTNQGTPRSNLPNPRTVLESKVGVGRANLLMVLLFTLINCALIFTGSTTYFLFSAYIPYIFVGSATILTGHMPDEFYGDEKPIEFYPDSFLYVAIAVAVVILICYLVCWMVIKKHAFAGCLCALILFGMDSVLLLLGIVIEMSFDLSAIIDIAFHAWVLYYLIVGLIASVKLKKLPPEPQADQYAVYPDGVGTVDALNSQDGQTAIGSEPTSDPAPAGVTAEPVNPFETNNSERSADGEGNSPAED